MNEAYPWHLDDADNAAREASRLRERAGGEEQIGRSVYADHLRKRADHLDAEARSLRTNGYAAN